MTIKRRLRGPSQIECHGHGLSPIERLWLILKAEWFSRFYAKTMFIDGDEEVLVVDISRPP
ncbi:MAG: hypothetical protein WCP72_12420 [Desulfomonile sp.]